MAAIAALTLVVLALVPAGTSTTVLPYTTWGTTSFEWTGSVWTTNDGGPYNNGECGGVDAGLPSLLLASTEVSFDHDYDIETRWDAGFILASGDGGLTWSYLNLPDYPALGSNTAVNTCVNGVTGESVFDRNGFTGFGGGAVTVDLADYGFGIGDLVQLRFVFATDSSVVYPGWTIGDLTIGGVPQWVL